MSQTITPDIVRQAMLNLLTTRDLARIARKTELTILNWRKKGLPIVTVPGSGRDSVRFIRDEAIAWMKENGHRVYLEDEVGAAA